MSMYWPPRRWPIVRRIRSHYGLPCLPAACVRTGQFASNCICYQNHLKGGEAMTHDPLCPTVNADVPFGLFHDDVPDDCLFCALITKVREDERGYAKQTSTAIMAYDEGRRDGYAAALRDAVEAVKAALTDDDGYVRQSELDDAVAAIETLGGER